MAEFRFEGIDETGRQRLSSLSPVVAEGGVDVVGCQLSELDRLGHREAGLWGFGLGPASQLSEIGRIGGPGDRGAGTIEQQAAQQGPILVAADEFAHVLACGSVLAAVHLPLGEGLEFVRQRDVHGRHEGIVSVLTKIAKSLRSEFREVR